MTPDRVEMAYAVLRAVAGGLFIVHGLQKVLGLFGGQQVGLSRMLGVAGMIETTAGALIIIGLYTTVAAFIASGEMAAAYFMAHAPKGALPIQNGGELAVLFCFVFLYVAARGDGAWSVGELLESRKTFTRRVTNLV